MQLAVVYKDLLESFAHPAKGDVIPVKLSEIALKLSCTHRNANFILHKLNEKKWITWKAGRGRGNVSLLTFLVTMEEVYIEIAQHMAERGDFNQAIDIVNNQVVDGSLKNRFFQWISNRFGYSSQQVDNVQEHSLSLPIHHLSTLDPMFTACGVEAHLIRFIYDTLVVFNKETNNFEGRIAHHWEKNDECTEWTFYIRKGVFFHNGIELKARDIKFSFERLRESHYKWMVSDIESIEVIHDWSIRIKLTHANGLFEHYVASHQTSILSEKVNNIDQFPIGTGPFTFEREENRNIMKANERYFRGRPFLDRIELWPIAENLHERNEDERPDIFKLSFLKDLNHHTRGRNRLIKKVENGCKLITFNEKKPGPQQHKWFREAVALGLNKEELMTKDEYMAASNLLPGQEGTYLDEGNLERARQLLSTYNGEPVYLYTSSYHLKDALIIQRQCKEIGIHLQTRLIEKKTEGPYPQLHDADMILYESLYEDDLIFTLLETYMTEDSYIRRHLNSDMLTKIEQKIRQKMNLDSSALLDELLSIEKELLCHFSIIPLYRRIHTLQYPEALKGVSIGALGWVDFASIWY